MKKIILLFAIAISAISCIKEQIPIVKDNLILGYWMSKEYNFVIKNTNGSPDPYMVTKTADSLHVSLLPVVNLHYKIISVDYKHLIVSSNNKNIIYDRATEHWEK